MESFDIIVVGGGHAGAEAAAAAARQGLNVALFTLSMDAIGKMSCSPSIGGLAKSHLVKEIDALGGLMAEAADETAIQYRLLNTKKGPAVQATRTQNDKRLYESAIKRRLEKLVHLRQYRVDQLVVESGQIKGVIDHTGGFTAARAVVIAAGTFLSGLIHIGESQIRAGRAGEEGSYELAQNLRDLGFVTGRHKTGTPPRLNRHTLNFERMEIQPPDEQALTFGFEGGAPKLPQVACWQTRTNFSTHQIVRENIQRSSLYSGAITGQPARYCPSFEDKVMRFGDREGHHIIVEPEGLDTIEVYAGGLGNSLPVEIQREVVHSIAGFENAEIMRPGYAIEYDYVLPHQLKLSLETKLVAGLFHAGQINGTSGYEEAAAQGLLAGINAGRYVRNEEPLILNRSEAYIGVMVDDLATQGTSEPYRMFTSRAEYRLLLRQSNAVLRLTDKARELGLVSNERHERISGLQREIECLSASLERVSVLIPDELPVAQPTKNQTSERVKLANLLKRPEIGINDLKHLLPPASELALAEAEIETKYAGYIDRQLAEVERFKQVERVQIPEDFDYETVAGLSNELKAKLAEVRPANLGQASHIQGMTPAGIVALQVAIKSRAQAAKAVAVSC